MNNKNARHVFDIKLILAYNCRKGWPVFALCEEDIILRDIKWNSKFDGKMVIMWDNTNANFKYKSAISYIQRLTYSMCYRSNCAKGGVAKQLCSWQGNKSLWTGGASDTGYFVGDYPDNKNINAKNLS